MITFETARRVAAVIQEHVTLMQNEAETALAAGNEDFHSGYIAATKEINRVIGTAFNMVKEGY